MFWKKYSTCIYTILVIIVLFGLLILAQGYIGGQETAITQNNSNIVTQNKKSMTENIFPVIYVLIGGLFTFIFTEYRSVKSEEKVFSILKMDINTNLDILEFNRQKVELESRTKGINYIPLKLFKTDFWNLVNYNSPKKLINEELYSKISEAVLIMNSFNETNQIREQHKVFKKERIPKDKIFNDILKKEINNLSELLFEIEKSL